ncbi:unnamed protein product [Vicia faba]|uniref:ABC transporter domain-containing protein n=1 Tax=Vicia faba TaxID=3906 RepID=A0AAV1BCX9_VICFA|nr:unnamed protein product [Vicia faba]
MGLLSLIVFSTYRLAMWYGSMLVLEKGYIGGPVMSVIIAFMTGEMSLDVQIFVGFSLFVPSGTTNALVGQSGSGKFTVISLLERFYDHVAREVLIDGVNLNNLQLKWIRNHIGLVSQEPILFTTTIRENIVYGKQGATDEEITAEKTLANARKFIDKLPQGLDTMAGQNL